MFIVGFCVFGRLMCKEKEDILCFFFVLGFSRVEYSVWARVGCRR